MLTRVVALLALLASPVAAQPARVVAIAPLSTLGTEDTSAGTRKLTQQLEAAFAALPATKVVTATQVADAIKKSKRPQLKACERDPACLAEVGRLVGANIVVDGEVGGLADARVVYLGATDVASAKELRSTTLSVGAKQDAGGGTAGAAVRLLEPDRYRGTLRFKIDVGGATVFVNGTKVAIPGGQVALPVGTQAIRVTHPEYRDFVRFIDVEYGRTLDVPVGMQQYPIITHDLQGKPIVGVGTEYIDPPWYKSKLAIGVGLGLTMIATAVVVGWVVHDFPGTCRRVGGGEC